MLRSLVGHDGMWQDGILDGVEEQSKGLQALGHKIQGQMRSQQDSIEKQLNRLRTDMARILAPAKEAPRPPQTGAGAPEPRAGGLTCLGQMATD